MGVPRNMRSSAPARAASVLFAAQLLLVSAPVFAAEPGAEPGVAVDSHVADSAADDFLAEYDDLGAGDPLEPSNRVVFGANETIYQYVFDPLASAYGFLLPSLVRHSVLHFFENLGEPANFLNELMQLNPVRAGRTGARFAINTTVGVVGLFDPAKRLGLPRTRRTSARRSGSTASATAGTSSSR